MPSGASGRSTASNVTRFEIALVTFLALAMFLPGIWSYTLVDPWETHYAEVARRMLQDHDWVHTQWQDEGFRSKPILTFWLIGASMRMMGIGADGGYSGEMTASSLVMLAVRLPFVLFGVLGLVLMWWMLAWLVSRRVAWLALLVLATTPFYFFVVRQAITDMPMIGCLIGSMACFAMALDARDTPLQPLWGKVTAKHAFLALLGFITGAQIIYYAYLFTVQPSLAAGVRFPVPQVILPGVMLIGLVVIFFWTIKFQPVRTARQVYMHWFFLFLGISTLAKGLPAIGLAGVICFFYVLVTNSWRQLGKLEIPVGVLICMLIVVPWHFAMYLEDGRPFLRDYFITHNWQRAAIGVHGERGTFDFFLSQIGIGMWPWIAFLPAAMAGIVSSVASRTRAGHVRLIIGLWAVVTVAFFCAVPTKFHHYILPAIPALAIAIAFWLDDVLAGRIHRIGLVSVLGAGIVLLLTRDLMGEQKQFIELFVYRYDRPWPSGEPWNIDLSSPLLAFGLLFAGQTALFGARTFRRAALVGLAVTALAFAWWSMNVYMRYAATHWGMRDAIRTYYAEREIHGIEIQYYGARQITDEWEHFTGSYEFETVIPDHLSPDRPMRIAIALMNRGNQPEAEVTLHGQVSRIGDHRITVAIPDAEFAKLGPLIERGRNQPRPGKRPWKQVDADRLIGWQLYWRGENFWSGDEIWGRSEDTKTAFKNTDNKEFLKYLNSEGRVGRRYFLITEAGRVQTLRNILPTQLGKDTYEILDRSSNKFTLLSFTL